MMDRKVPLAQVTPEMYRRWRQRGPGYSKLYKLAIDGLIPTVRQGNRIFVEESVLPEVAALVGIDTKAV